MSSKVFVFLGKSGSGKGTQALLLKEYLEKNDSRPTLYYEGGASFRALAEEKTRAGKLLGERLARGDLLPVFLPIWAWTNFLLKRYTGAEHIIFDGLARREIEAPILDSAMEFYGVEHIEVVYLEVSDVWARERLLGRGRGDDHEREIEERLKWFSENTMDAVEYFRAYERGHFHAIDGEQTVEEVHAEIITKVFGGNAV